MFLERYRAETTASLAPWLGLLVLALPGRAEARRVAGPLVAGAVVHFVAYSLLAVPPFHWYYAVELVAGVVVAGLAVASSAERSWAQEVAAAGLLVALVAASTWLDGRRLVTPAPEMPIHTNWTPTSSYALRPGEERFVLRSRWMPEGRELIWIPRRPPAATSPSDDSSPVPDRP